MRGSRERSSRNACNNVKRVNFPRGEILQARGLEELADRSHDSAAVLLKQLGELAERAFAADVADDLAQLVVRNAGLLGGGADGVAGGGMRLAQRGDRRSTCSGVRPTFAARLSIVGLFDSWPRIPSNRLIARLLHVGGTAILPISVPA